MDTRPGVVSRRAEKGVVTVDGSYYRTCRSTADPIAR
jgi:hypothetical protein